MTYEQYRKIGNVNTILLVAFIILKLFGMLSFSWLWVFAPLWIPAIFVGIVMGYQALVE